jgi:N6-adenosine-specific RNA methylase IME4
VSRVANKDAVLFLWGTWPLLPDIIRVGESWGFTYKTIANLWVKENRIKDSLFMGMGYWTRSNSEPLLLFTRGKPKRKSAGVRQVVVSPIRKHSQKPNEVYDAIEALVDGPYLELYARTPRPGWVSVGNELDENPQRGAINADVFEFCNDFHLFNLELISQIHNPTPLTP